MRSRLLCDQGQRARPGSARCTRADSSSQVKLRGCFGDYIGFRGYLGDYIGFRGYLGDYIGLRAF